MANLLNYVGSGSRIGGRNNIWRNAIFFYNVGDGTFTQLSPNRMRFEGSTYFLGNRQPFNLRVELLSDTRCDVVWQETTYGNRPYQIINNVFTADLERDTRFYMSRYNEVETAITINVEGIVGPVANIEYHLQPV